jgi:hypothetical protein
VTAGRMISWTLSGIPRSGCVVRCASVMPSLRMTRIEASFAGSAIETMRSRPSDAKPCTMLTRPPSVARPCSQCRGWMRQPTSTAGSTSGRNSGTLRPMNPMSSAVPRNSAAQSPNPRVRHDSRWRCRNAAVSSRVRPRPSGNCHTASAEKTSARGSKSASVQALNVNRSVCRCSGSTRITDAGREIQDDHARAVRMSAIVPTTSSAVTDDRAAMERACLAASSGVIVAASRSRSCRRAIASVAGFMHRFENSAARAAAGCPLRRADAPARRAR